MILSLTKDAVGDRSRSGVQSPRHLVTLSPCHLVTFRRAEVGQPRVDPFDRLGADLLRQVIPGLEQGDWLLTPGDGSSIARPAYSAKRGRWTACEVESS